MHSLDKSETGRNTEENDQDPEANLGEVRNHQFAAGVILKKYDVIKK
jgi:hypothetical protein